MLLTTIKYSKGHQSRKEQKYHILRYSPQKISCFYTTLDIFSKRNYLKTHDILLTDGFKRTLYLTNKSEQSHLV